MMDFDPTLLTLHLSFAVPLKIAEMQRWAELPPITPATQEQLAVLLAEYTEFAVFGGIPTSQRGIPYHDEENRKRGVPQQFIREKPINLIVGIVALLAFQPAGIDLFGLHFEAKEDSDDAHAMPQPAGGEEAADTPAEAPDRSASDLSASVSDLWQGQLWNL